MKHILLMSFSLCFLSCGSDVISVTDFSYSPTTHWQLEATLNDPGDGSGTFEEIVSERLLVFEVDRVLSNGSLCELDGPVGEVEFVSHDVNTPEFFITGCDTTETPRLLTYTLQDDPNKLVVDIGCEEPCLLRYKRIDF